MRKLTNNWCGPACLLLSLALIIPSAQMIQGDDLYVSGCAIRMTDTTGQSLPVIHRNVSHPAPGCDTLTIETSGTRHGQSDFGVIRITFTENRRVVAVMISDDEATVGLPVRCGASGGVSHTNIYCWDEELGRYLDFYDPADRARAATPSGNLWLTVISTGPLRP